MTQHRLAAAIFSMSAAACSSDAHIPLPHQATDASLEAGYPDAHAAVQGAGGTPTLFIDARAPDAGDAGYCAAEIHRAQTLALDLLLLMDGSASMTDSVENNMRKWDVVVDAIRAFLNDPASAGIGVGLEYFGIPDGSDAGDFGVSCKVSDYAMPSIPIGNLLGSARALVDSLSHYEPIGGTPTRPALAGAEQYARAWTRDHPTHRTVIVLATDGEPNDCDSTVESVSAIAAAGARMTPSLPLYVIGVGANLTTLDQVAAAGGTEHAYLVDVARDTASRFVAAMNAIRAKTRLPCEYEIPRSASGELVDFERVNVAFTGVDDAGSASKQVLLQVADRAACATMQSGWYYDDPASPKGIELCASACELAKANLTGQVEVLVGCRTESATPR